MSDETKRAQNECHPESAWLDYARGLTRDEVAKAMQEHLVNGCDRCEATFGLWAKSVELSRREAAYTPPTDVVASVKKAYAVSRRVPFLESLAVAARLVFDTFLEPAPAGVRGVAPPSRHLVHETDDTVVDIKIDDEYGVFACLTGQILTKNANPAEAGGTLVFLVSGQERLVAQTYANEVGEFQINLENNADLRVYLHLPTGQLISLGLPDDVFRAAQ